MPAGDGARRGTIGWWRRARAIRLRTNEVQASFNHLKMTRTSATLIGVTRSSKARPSRRAGFAHAGGLLRCGAPPESLPELALLDIMLPEVDGLEVLRARCARTRPTKLVPVMMLTAKGTEFDTVCGLDAGADDYLAKPFGMMELVSRVRANALSAPRRGKPQRAGRRHEHAGECGPIDAVACSAHTVSAGGVARRR